VKAYRAANNHSLEMARALNALADTLALAGRGSEASKPLEEAQEIAKDLKNDELNSRLLSTQGDIAFYQGDLKAARSAYEQAAAIGIRSKDQDVILLAKMNLTRLAVADGRYAAAVADLRTQIKQADALHLKYLSVRGSVDLSEALLRSKDYARAQEELQAALRQAEKLGLHLESARIHYLMGEALRLSGNTSDASGQYQQARALLDGIKQESGADKISERSDLKNIFAAK